MIEKKIIGIVSCKGGVGKTTLAINTALSLATCFNKKVGLLDADIYGPNHPTLLNTENEIQKLDIQKIEPINKFNIKSVSMGYFVNENTSILLRGPMASNTIKHILSKTNWGDIEYLIIDFPAGTGDIYLSLLRDIKFDSAIVITTIQNTSIENVKRSIKMLEKFNIKISALIKNMTYYTCEKCQEINKLNYDEEKIEKLIEEFNIKNIHEIPFDKNIIISSYEKIPYIIKNKNSEISKTFKKISENIM